MVTFWSCWAAGHVASALITAAATRKKRFAIFIDAPVGGSASRNPPYTAKQGPRRGTRPTRPTRVHVAEPALHGQPRSASQDPPYAQSCRPGSAKADPANSTLPPAARP